MEKSNLKTTELIFEWDKEDNRYNEIEHFQADLILSNLTRVKRAFGSRFEDAENYDEINNYVAEVLGFEPLLIFETVGEAYNYHRETGDNMTFLKEQDNIFFNMIVKDYSIQK